MNNQSIQTADQQTQGYIEQFTASLNNKNLAQTFVTQLMLRLKQEEKIAAILSSDEGKRTAFISQMISCAAAGLSPDPSLHHFCFIPFKDEVRIIIMYQGFIKVARDNGVNIIPKTVHEKDEYEYNISQNNVHYKKYLAGDPGPAIAYFAIAKQKGSIIGIEEMSKYEIQLFRDKNTGSISSNSPWNTHFDEMAKKTVIRKLIKYLGLDFNASLYKILNEFDNGLETVSSTDTPSNQGSEPVQSVDNNQTENVFNLE